METSIPKKYTCAWCRKKYVSRIRLPFVLDRKHSRIGNSNKVEKLGDPVIIQGHPISAPGSPRFEGTKYACSSECYKNLTGSSPP